MNSARTAAIIVLRSARTRRSVVGVAVAAALLGYVFVVLSSLALDGEQLADRELGTSDASLRLDVAGSIDSTRGLARAAASAARGADGTDVSARVTSFSILPDSLVTGGYTGPQPLVVYVEQGDLLKRAPGRYTLESGRWPARPGEVALSGALAQELRSPKQISVLANRLSMEVVGVARDDFARRGLGIYAATGTLGKLDVSAARQAFQGLDIQVMTFWSGAAPAAVATAVAKELDYRASRGSVLASVIERSELSAAGQSSLVERLPLAYRVPLGLSLVAAAAFAVGLSRRRLRGQLAVLQAVGLPSRQMRWGMTLAFVILSSAAAVAGGLSGELLGAASRPVVQQLNPAPLSPLPNLLIQPAVYGIIVAVTTGSILSLALSRPHAGLSPRSVDISERKSSVVGARRVIGAALLAVGVVTTLSADSLVSISVAAALLTIVALAFVPDLLGLATRLIGTDGPAGLVARRSIDAERRRFAATTVALTASMVVPIASGVLVATLLRTQEADTNSLAAPGQVLVSNNGRQIPAQVRNALAALPDIDEPVAISLINDDVRFSTSGSGGQFGIITVATTEDLRRLLGDVVNDDVSMVLSRGGVVDWSGAETAQSLVGSAVGGTTGEIPTASVVVDRAYSGSFAGAMLKETAEAARFQLAPEDLVFTGVQDDEARQMSAAVRDLGFDRRLVQPHVEPPPTELPADWLVATVLLAASGVTLVMIVMRGQAVHFRNYASQLLALGLPVSLSGRIVILQSAVVGATALLSAVIASVAPVAAFSSSSVGVVLDIPVEIILTVVSLTAIGVIGAVAISLRAVKAVPGSADL